MGYPNSNHIKVFVKGKTIKDLEQNDHIVKLTFEDGEYLTLYCNIKVVKGLVYEYITTPYRANGEVKQSLDILDINKQKL
jgi:hypothetical protein